MKMYLVGGAVRDEILGTSSKDYDYTVVLEDADLRLLHNGTGHGNNTPFSVMVFQLRKMGFKIFLETPEHFTVRAKFPKGHKHERITADFVLARREGPYSDGRRPDFVEVGTLEDDLARRDFTMNAIAKDSDGNLIDPYNGQRDIEEGVIRAVGDPFERLEEDALRAVRALRFSVTKQFTTPDNRKVPFFIDLNLQFAMESVSVLDAIRTKISDERIRDELSKMFRFDTVASLSALAKFPELTKAMFAGSVSLDATMKLKGRGK